MERGEQVIEIIEWRMIMAKNVVCKKCNNLVNDWCKKVIDSPDQDMQRDCQYFCEKTNADRIRAMTDEELALWICGVYDIEEENGKFINGIIIPGYTPHDIEEWLQQPAEEVDNETVGERKDGADND